MFPSETGTLRTPGGLWKAWRAPHGEMRNHYSTVGLDEKLVAVSSVHRLVRLGSGDAGGDATAQKKSAGEA